MDIAGKVALITGSAAGIGRATALLCGREGAAVVIADIDAQGGRATVAEIASASGRAAFVSADVAQEGDVGEMMAFAERHFGGLDVLVNNAGGVDPPNFPNAALQQWGRVLDVNLRGVMLGTQYGIEAMRRRGGGVIINIASLAGIGYGAHDAPEYAASKAGVVRFSAALAPLKETLNIRVNCICPDWVDTPAVQRTRAAMTPAQWARVAPILTPADKIAEVVVELIRDDTLAGRVQLCPHDAPWKLAPVSRA